jgi:hypothetical protein
MEKIDGNIAKLPWKPVRFPDDANPAKKCGPIGRK